MSGKSNGLPTLRSIAELTGLSMPTVSQVLSNKGGLYRQETRQKVLRAARELGYRPNAAARAISTGRFGCVALVTSDRPNRSYIAEELLHALLDRLDQRNVHLALMRMSDERLTSEQTIPKILRQWLVDGLLIDYITLVPQRMIALLHQHHIASIWLNNNHLNDSVYPDDFEAAQRATTTLLELGHRRIGYAYNRISAHYSAQARYDGYVQAMQTAGLSPRRMGPENVGTFTQAVNSSMLWLSQPDRPTAVVVYTTWNARAILRAAEQLRMSIPRDLSIITFDNDAVEEYSVTFSTLTLPNVAMAEFATELLQRKIDNPSTLIKSIAVPFGWNAGSSLAPPLS